MDQGSTRKRSAVHNFAPTVTKFCVMWEGQALPHDTKFGNSRCEIVGRRVIFIWSLIHGSSWSGLIKVVPVLLKHSWNIQLSIQSTSEHNRTYVCRIYISKDVVGTRLVFYSFKTWLSFLVVSVVRSKSKPVLLCYERHKATQEG